MLALAGLVDRAALADLAGARGTDGSTLVITAASRFIAGARGPGGFAAAGRACVGVDAGGGAEVEATGATGPDGAVPVCPEGAAALDADDGAPTPISSRTTFQTSCRRRPWRPAETTRWDPSCLLCVRDGFLAGGIGTYPPG